MKFLTKAAIYSVLIFAAAWTVAAQAAKPGVWAVDFVKTKSGEQLNYLKFIEQNWAQARSFMKDKGIVASYLAVSVPANDKTQWDVLLMTEYVDEAGYERREKVFEDYRRMRAAVTVGGKSGRDLSEIKVNRTFRQPISKEIAEIMLRAQSDDQELAAARLPLENYLKGHATGDPEFMRKAFHAEGNLIFIREGKYATRSFAEYIAGMSGKPAADEDRRRRYIESVEIAGNAGVGKIILDYPAVKFVDYMTLLKIGGEWKIVNKSFYAEPKAQPNK